MIEEKQQQSKSTSKETLFNLLTTKEPFRNVNLITEHITSADNIKDDIQIISNNEENYILHFASVDNMQYYINLGKKQLNFEEAIEYLKEQNQSEIKFFIKEGEIVSNKNDTIKEFLKYNYNIGINDELSYQVNNTSGKYFINFEYDNVKYEISINSKFDFSEAKLYKKNKTDQEYQEVEHIPYSQMISNKDIKTYRSLSEIQPDTPKKENVVLGIGDLHGDLFALLYPLVQSGIVAVQPDRTESSGYKLVEGPNRKYFKSVVFLGDYVDRGESSIEVMKNVVKLNKLFNATEDEVYPIEEEDNKNFIKFLCGNHDTLYTFGQYGDQQDHLLRNLKFSQYSEDRTLIHDFYDSLSVAHVENLSKGKKIYFTHSYCTAEMKKSLDGDGVYRVNGDEINLLDKGTIYQHDALNMRQLQPSSIFDRLLWVREYADDKDSQYVRTDERHVREDNELFIHGHEVQNVGFNNLKQKFYRQANETRLKLINDGEATMDYANSSAYYPEHQSNSSYINIDQEGYISIQGGILELDEKSHKLTISPCRNFDFLIPGYTRQSFEKNKDILDTKNRGLSDDLSLTTRKNSDRRATRFASLVLTKDLVEEFTIDNSVKENTDTTSTNLAINKKEEEIINMIMDEGKPEKQETRQTELQENVDLDKKPLSEDMPSKLEIDKEETINDLQRLNDLISLNTEIDNSSKGSLHIQLDDGKYTLYGYDKQNKAFFKIKDAKAFFDGKYEENGIILKKFKKFRQKTTEIKDSDEIVYIKDQKLTSASVKTIFSDYSRKKLIHQPGVEYGYINTMAMVVPVSDSMDIYTTNEKILSTSQESPETQRGCWPFRRKNRITSR